jgi:hypothetical protein
MENKSSISKDGAILMVVEYLFDSVVVNKAAINAQRATLSFGSIVPFREDGNIMPIKAAMLNT